MEKREDNGTFTQIPNVFFDTCDLPESAQILYMRLYRHIHYTGCTFRGSVRTLSNLVRLSKSTTDRMVKRLHESHLIQLVYEKGKENNREIMVITLHKDQLWALNKSYCAGNAVPNWDKEIPDCPNLGHDTPKRDILSQIGTFCPVLGQNVPPSSSNEATIITNNNNNEKESEEQTSPSHQKVPYFIKGEIRKQSCLKGESQYVDENAGHANQIYTVSGLDRLTFENLLKRAVVAAEGRSMSYFFDHLCLLAGVEAI